MSKQIDSGVNSLVRERNELRQKLASAQRQRDNLYMQLLQAEHERNEAREWARRMYKRALKAEEALARRDNMERNGYEFARLLSKAIELAQEIGEKHGKGRDDISDDYELGKAIEAMIKAYKER